MADPKNYTNTPPSALTAWANFNEVGLYSGSVYDVLTGSGLQQTAGDVVTYPDYELMIASASGSGPTYVVNFRYEGTGLTSSEGMYKPKIGDELLVVNNENFTDLPPLELYRYQITSYSNSGAGAGTATVKYLIGGGGYTSPAYLYSGYISDGYGGYVAISRVLAIVRGAGGNAASFLIDII